MASLREITSADVAATMTVDTLYPSGFPLEMFGSDSGITGDNVTIAETRMTLDGKLVAGAVPNPYPITLTFEAASPTLPYLQNLRTASAREVFEVNLTVRIRATGEVLRFNRGFLVTSNPFPNVAKTLQPLTFQFMFESMERN